jgi:hypothetical protein
MAPMKLYTWSEKPRKNTRPPKQIQPSSSKSSKVQEFFSIKFSVEKTFFIHQNQKTNLWNKKDDHQLCGEEGINLLVC